MTNTSPTRSLSDAFHPVPGQIEELIQKASVHPLGIKFLLDGDLCSVAILFGVNVFAVEAARTKLQQQEEN